MTQQPLSEAQVAFMRLGALLTKGLSNGIEDRQADHISSFLSGMAVGLFKPEYAQALADLLQADFDVAMGEKRLAMRDLAANITAMLPIGGYLDGDGRQRHGDSGPQRSGGGA